MSSQGQPTGVYPQMCLHCSEGPRPAPTGGHSCHLGSRWAVAGLSWEVCGSEPLPAFLPQGTLG